jgi:hypothetical protein
MVSWWPGDGDAVDIVDGNHGTLQNGATFGTGMVGQAFRFSGPGDMVTVEHDPSLNLESLPNATFEGWFKSNIGNDALIIAKHFCGIPYGWFFTTGQGGYIGDHWVGGLGVGGRNLNDGNFHHFAIVKNGTYYYEYIDGVEISHDTGPSVGTPAPYDVPLQIGSINTGTCSSYPVQLYGQVDEVSIYNRALSADDIQAIYDAGSAGKCKFIPVSIDIKPGSDPNSINLGEHGLLPVAILGSPEFDVETIDPATIVIGGVSLALRGPAKKVQKLAYSYEDVDLEDGYTDRMMIFFDVWKLVDEGVLTEGTTELLLTATLYDGTLIEGKDAVNIVH